jgi:hypothetical protein
MAIQFDNTNTGVVTLRPGTAADAIIVGGTSSTASGTNAAIVGGSSNDVISTNGIVVGGTSNQAWGSNNTTVVGGQSNRVTGDNAVALGGSGASASALRTAVVGGQNNTADGANAAVVGGAQGATRSIIGNFVTPASNVPIQSATGRQQLATLLLGRQTTDATATVLTSNTSGAGTTNQVILPNNSAYYFRGEVIAGVTGAGDTKGWYVEGVIKRGANAASTALVGTPSATSLYADAGAATWSIAVTADTTNGGLAITVTGAAATTIRWVAQIRTTEMTF